VVRGYGYDSDDYDFNDNDDDNGGHTTMDEQMLNRILMIAAAVVAIASAIATATLLVLTAVQSMWLIIPTILLAVFTVGCGMAASYYGQRFTGHAKVFANPIEQEVLSRRQRRELRNKRGELVMERSLVEIEHERDNIVHRQIEAANDPNKPPHQTRFGD
jgi:hypothetical protein